MSENTETNETNPQDPPNFDDIVRQFLLRSTNDILNTPYTPDFNTPLIQSQPFPSNLNILHSPISLSNSTNTSNTSNTSNLINASTFMHVFGSNPGMSGAVFGDGFGDILERSMQDTGGATKPTCQDTIDSLSIVEIFNDTIQCAICQETLKNGSKAIKLPCPDTPHYFCLGDDPDKCAGIKPWLKDNNTCPICRFELPIEEKKKETDIPSLEPILPEGHEGHEGHEVPEVPEVPLINDTFRNMIRGLIQEETTYVDDDGFDTREFEEAIHRSLDDSPTNADATAQAASTGDLNAMREMRLQRLEQEKK
jgi:hypothetical protein